MSDLHRKAGRRDRMLWSPIGVTKWAIIGSAGFQDSMFSFEQERWSERWRLWTVKSSGSHRRRKTRGNGRPPSLTTKIVSNRQLDVSNKWSTWCPYCLRRQERSGEESFTDVAGFHPTDTPNQKKMILKIHSLGCGRVFIAVYDIKKGEYIACFRLPQEDWVKSIFRRSPV